MAGELTTETTVSIPSVRLVRGSTRPLQVPTLEIRPPGPEGVVARVYDQRGGSDDYVIELLDPGDDHAWKLHHIQIPPTRWNSPSNQPWASTSDLPTTMGQRDRQAILANHMDPRREKLLNYDTGGNDETRLRSALGKVRQSWVSFDRSRRTSPSHPPVFDFDDLTGAIDRVMETKSLVKFDSTNPRGTRP